VNIVSVRENPKGLSAIETNENKIIVSVRENPMGLSAMIETNDNKDL